MTATPGAEREASRQRHAALTQLEVTRTLRVHQREWFAQLRSEVFERAAHMPSAARSFRTRSSKPWTCRSSPTSGTRAWSPRAASPRTTPTFSPQQGYHEG